MEEREEGRKEGRTDGRKENRQEGKWARLDTSAGRFWPTGRMFVIPDLDLSLAVQRGIAYIFNKQYNNIFALLLQRKWKYPNPSL